MKIKLVNKIFWVFPLVGFAVAGAAYPFLPGRLATHWDASGQPDQYWHKGFLFVIPLVLTFCVFVFTWLPTLPVRGKQKKKFQPESPLVQVFFFLIILAAEVLTVLFSLGLPLDGNIAAPLAVGMACVIFGSLLAKIKSGYKTSGTPAAPDGEGWSRTFQTAGQIWIAGGTILMAAGLLPSAACLGVCLGTAALMLTLPFLFSVLLFRKGRGHKSKG